MRTRLYHHVVAAAALAMFLTVLPFATAGASTPNLRRDVEYLRVGSVSRATTIDQAMSSPALGDVTGDGLADVVVGSMDGKLTVLDPTSGQVLRQVVVQDGAQIHASPTLADITGDGVLDVVIGTVFNQPGKSHVKGYDMVPSGGRVVFDRTDSGQTPGSGFFGTAVGDIDGDGVVEIVAPGCDHRIHAWELNGSYVSGFPTYTYDTSLSTPALADVDRDGAKEIIFGADMDWVNQPLPGGGYLWVVRGNGQPLPGYPFKLSNEVIWSSPAVGDVDHDGDLDVIVGAGLNFDHSDKRKLYGIDLLSRQALPGWPRTLRASTMGSPALANLDSDPQLEVIASTGDGALQRLEHDGTTTWSTCVDAVWSACSNDNAIIASPVIADVDDDPEPEVVMAVNRELMVVSAATGAIEARESIRSNPGDFAWPAANAVAVARRGSRTYIAAYVQIDNGDLRRADGDRQGVYVWSTAATASSMPWAQFHRDVARSGTIDNAAPVRDLGKFVNAAYTDLLGRSASSSERSYWVNAIRAGLSRYDFALALARSPEWTGVVVTGLYRQIFDRQPDAGGKAYWSGLIANGLRVSEVASHFYGSDEWYRSAPPTGGGGTNRGFVDNLYRRVLGREPDSAKAYWYDLVNRGTNRKTIANAFYLSYESNARRVDQLYRVLLDRPSEPAGRDYWAQRFTIFDDIQLAAILVSSDEYLARNG